MKHETDELQNSFQHFSSEIGELQKDFDLADIKIQQDDILSFLGIPAAVFPEFQDPTNLQNLLFFEFLNQAFGLYLVSFIENTPQLLESPLHSAIEHLQNDCGLPLLFQPDIISEIEASATDLCRRLFDLLSQLNLSDLITLDLFGSFLQNLLSQATRKRFAANYTILDAAQLLAHLTIASHLKRIVDPMGGSGRLIFSSLDAFQLQGISFAEALPRMVLNELFLPAVQLFYTKLLIRILGDTQGDLNLIRVCEVAFGDAFQNFQAIMPEKPSEKLDNLARLVGTCDLVIMNPPFTRQGILENNYRTFLGKRFAAFKPYINRHMGLHGYAIFLAHELLQPGGSIAAVLPAATIYSGYGEGLKQFLLENYTIQVVLTSAVIKAFSEGSDFRELILICRKLFPSQAQADYPIPSQVKFISVRQNMQDVDLPALAAEINASSQNGETDGFKVTLVPQGELESNKNWLYFFESVDFKDLYANLTDRYPFLSSLDAGFRLVRGFEMYGPNYFLLPNKYWRIAREMPESVVFASLRGKGDDQQIQIPRQYLVKSLRKPQECESQISFEPGYYALSVPKTDTVPVELESYIEWGLQAALPAIKRFGDGWLHHVHAQLETKQPYGRVFVADKISVNGIHNFAYFFPDPITCTKNFYVFRTEDAEKDEFLAAWLNSSVFFFLFLAERREIGGSYGRLQIADYKALPLFVQIDPENPAFTSVLEAFRAICALNPLPFLHEQFALPERVALDNAFLSYLGIPKGEIDSYREQIYAEITHKLQSLEARD